MESVENAIKTGVKPQKKITGLILAGGLAKRFGGGKCRAKLKGKPLIAWVYEAISPFCAEIWLSWRRPPYEGPELPFSRIIYDERPGAGPAVALNSALKKKKEGYLLVLPCDQPLVRPKLLKKLIKTVQDEPFWETVVFTDHQRLLPFPGLYSKATTIENGTLKELVAKTKSLVIPERVWREWDEKGLSFFNINFREDLKKAEGLIEKTSPFKTMS